MEGVVGVVGWIERELAAGQQTVEILDEIGANAIKLGSGRTAQRSDFAGMPDGFAVFFGKCVDALGQALDAGVAARSRFVGTFQSAAASSAFPG